MSTQTGPIAISPRFNMSSVPALPGVITTYWLKSFRPVSALSIADAAVAELLRILLDPVVELRIRLRRGFDQVGVVRKHDLTVEHRQHVTVNVGAESVLGRVPADELSDGDVIAVRHQQLLLDHRRRGELVNNRNV